MLDEVDYEEWDDGERLHLLDCTETRLSSR